jgi:hypothetical protein
MDLEPFHVRHGRPFPYFPNELLDQAWGSFHHDLDRCIRQVADIPDQPLSFPDTLDKVAKTHTLHHAMNDDAPSLMRHAAT